MRKYYLNRSPKKNEEKKKKIYKRDGVEFDKPLGPKGTFNTGNPPKRYEVAEGGRIEYSKGTMPARNKKNFRPTKSGAGMTRAGVAAYRRANPGSKLKTAVTGKVKKGSAAAKRRKSYCARSAGQMKKFPKAAKDPNSRLRQARRRWKC